MKPEIVKVDDPHGFISYVEIYEWETIDGAKIYFVYADCHEKYLELCYTDSHQQEITYVFRPKTDIEKINEPEVAITFKNIEEYNGMRYIINMCEGQRYAVYIMYVFYDYLNKPPKLIAKYDCENKND